MALEIEAKFKVDSHDAVRARLIGLRAEWIGHVLETNTLFDAPDKRLFSAGCGLRIRTCEGDGMVPPANLTYKGPQQAGEFKVREELETVVTDPQAAAAIVQALGFSPAITFEKRRETWHVQQCVVDLDELPRLGCYIEIEGPNGPAVASVQQALGLADQPAVRSNYIALLIDHARAHNLPADRILFCP